MAQQLTWRQFAEWRIYAKLEPFGPLADNDRFGILTSAVTAAHGAKVHGRKPKPSDFFPKPRVRLPGHTVGDEEFQRGKAAFLSGLKAAGVLSSEP